MSVRAPQLTLHGVRVDRLTKAQGDKPARAGICFMGGTGSIVCPGDLFNQLEIGKEYQMLVGGEFRTFMTSFDGESRAQCAFQPSRLEGLPTPGEHAAQRPRAASA